MATVRLGWSLRFGMRATAGRVRYLLVRGVEESNAAVIPRMGNESERLTSDRLTTEEVNQFDDQDDDYHQFENECPALIEFVHHEAVELFGGLQFLLD